jgi:Holliday junction DNA helicase RuvA
MIGHLRGKLFSKKPSNIIIDVNGVGYEVNVPISILSSLPNEGEEVFISIHTYVREDAITLFGFANIEERRLFKALISVSGIGPKIGLSILSSMSANDFLNALASEEVSLLTKIPGLGKKTAQRLILELKGKLPKTAEAKDMGFEDALSALINLGYKRTDAQDAMDAAFKSGLRDVEALLRESLKLLNKSK